MECRDYKTTFVRLAPRMPGVLYEPVNNTEKSSIAIIAIHPENDYLDHPTGANMAKRGYTVLCANQPNVSDSLATKIFNVKYAFDYLKTKKGVKKIILMGHSGGATLMSAYQCIAENGVKVFQGPEKLFKCPDFLDGLPAADGFMSLDSNWGNGAMRLFSLDPAIVQEWDGLTIDESLNIFNPANGYSVSGAQYSEEFTSNFFRAQHDRNTRLIQYALGRLAAIEAGKGFYSDDEPMIIPGSVLNGPNNKLFPQDIRFLSKTKEAELLLHKGGVSTIEVVHTVRQPKNLNSLTPLLNRGTLYTSVKRFLDSYAVRTNINYGYNSEEVFGIDWTSSYNCTSGNVMGISVPMVIAGMTASWEFSAVETIYRNAKSTDKTKVYIDGAGHDFFTDTECERVKGEFGDTVKTLFDFIDQWLSASNRFI